MTEQQKPVMIKITPSPMSEGYTVIHKEAGHNGVDIATTHSTFDAAKEFATQLLNELNVDKSDIMTFYHGSDCWMLINLKGSMQIYIERLLQENVIPENLVVGSQIEELTVELRIDPLVHSETVDYVEVGSVTPRLKQTDDSEFLDYFQHEVDYPREVALNPLPINVCWNYISSTFLNGFINYVDIIDAHLLNRYRAEDELLEDLPSYQEPPGTFNWIKPDRPLTTKEAYDLYTQPGRNCHTNLHTFQDDVVLLSKAKSECTESKTTYVYFWFDSDVSDCTIGRFETDDAEETVIEKFRAHLNKLDQLNGTSHLPLPDHFFKGWLKF